MFFSLHYNHMSFRQTKDISACNRSLDGGEDCEVWLPSIHRYDELAGGWVP